MPLCAGIFHCGGDEGKCNWLLVREVAAATRCVVFFPGDISDFASPGAPYTYSLEGLLWVLCCKFPEDTIVVVRPRMMVGPFAAYANFMFVDATGNPRPLAQLQPTEDGRDVEVVSGQNAADDAGFAALRPPRGAVHLQELLRSLETHSGTTLPERLVLVGFSKGASVLSVLLKEAGEASVLWTHVNAVHFVDAGLTMPGASFSVTVDELRAVAAVAHKDFIVWLHGTPRQWQDPARPFVAEETGAFAERCRAAGVRVELKQYCETQSRSLDMHFDCLRCFYTRVDDPEGGEMHCGFFHAWGETATGIET